jgi:peptidoglycan/xylan/chitin deacetylase (PgdA/CDA1 family)
MKNGIRQIGQLARWLKNRVSPGSLILLYHRVVELPSDPQLLCVTPKHFAEHLEILRKQCRPIRLQQLAEASRNGNLPHLTVAVTFDDGYADNLYNAKPTLERYDMPATVFVTTGKMGNEREFWWDELERLLLQPATLPETLRLSINGSTHQWDLGKVPYDCEEEYQSYRRWNVLKQDDPTPRQRLYRSLCQLLRPLLECERGKVLDELLAWTGAESVGRPTHRTLSYDEVTCLGKEGLIDIGSHTVTHPVLSALSTAAQRTEIQRSKARLEEILGRPLTSFAYPYGTQSDYTAETTFMVRDAGFTCACSNFPAIIVGGTDRFQLPRLIVRDWDGEAFAHRLGEWLNG